jgi:hypothetical protein
MLKPAGVVTTRRVHYIVMELEIYKLNRKNNKKKNKAVNKIANNKQKKKLDQAAFSLNRMVSKSIKLN